MVLHYALEIFGTFVRFTSPKSLNDLSILLAQNQATTYFETVTSHDYSSKNRTIFMALVVSVRVGNAIGGDVLSAKIQLINKGVFLLVIRQSRVTTVFSFICLLDATEHLVSLV